MPSRLLSVRCASPAAAHGAGWLVYIALAIAIAWLVTRHRGRITIIPQALAISAVPCLGVLVFALLWRDAFAGSASTLVRNAAERLDLLPLVHRHLSLTPDQLVLREAELKWLLVRFGVGGTSAVCAMSGALTVCGSADDTALLDTSTSVTAAVLGLAWLGSSVAVRVIV